MKGIDFDGTLAEYDRWVGADHAGDPIQKNVERVRAWLKAGIEVHVVTARAHPSHPDAEVAAANKAISEFCLKNLGQRLFVTCMKHPKMDEIWDDKAVRVDKNTGEISSQDQIEDPLKWGSDGIGEFVSQ